MYGDDCGSAYGYAPRKVQAHFLAYGFAYGRLRVRVQTYLRFLRVRVRKTAGLRTPI